MKKVDTIEASVGIVENPEGFDGSFLLLKRKTCDRTFAGWCLPGGRLEPGESPEQALIREVKEETGYDVEVSRKMFVTDEFRTEIPFLVHVFVAKIVGGSLASFPTDEHEAFLIANRLPDFPDLGKVAKSAIREYLAQGVKN